MACPQARDSIGKEAECEEIVINIPSDLPPAEWPECCIYRVPKQLRKVNEEAYTPKLVSIGPFHHGREELRDMEMHKLRYFKEFLYRIRKRQGDLLKIIQDNEMKIRCCYSEECRLNTKDFVQMILLDAIFIIELFLKASSSEEEQYYILSKPWLGEGIFYDLILLENQLPFFVLEKLYTFAFNDSSSLSHQQEDQQIKEHQGDRNKEDTSFLKLSCCFFSRYDTQQDFNIGREVKHFTDLLRYFFYPPDLELKPIGEQYSTVYSATKLDEAGLQFKAGKYDRSLLDIRFPENKWLKCCPCFNMSWLLSCLPCLKCFQVLEGMERFLEVPVFEIDDQTECIFRNLMALEQCSYPTNAYICNYVVLMDDLINTEEDVALLVDKKVIINQLGRNNAVAELINNLGNEIVQPRSLGNEIVLARSCYSDLAEKLKKYCDNCWNRNMASLTSVYFRDFWRGTATVVGLIVLFFQFWDFLLSILEKKKKWD